jgi:hypothetical protein
MDIYETLYLITVTGQLGGQEFMDTLAVIFAIIVTGYFAGPRLTRPMVWGLTAISALFVGPMIIILYNVLVRMTSMAKSLPLDQIEQLPYLADYTFLIGPQVGMAILPASLAFAYAGAIYFVFHCHKKGSVTAAP